VYIPSGGASAVDDRKRYLVARARNTLIDVAVLAVVVGFGAAFLVARHDQTRYDPAARAIAAWSHRQGLTRIAWPVGQRAAVPTLLHSHVTPVLFDAQHPVPQQFVVKGTAVMVTPGRRDGPSTHELDAATRAQFRSGEFLARVVDLSVLARIPLAPGESVSQEISRPYVYAPLRDSRAITSSSALATHLTLEAGRYVVRIEAFDPDGPARMRIAAAHDSRTIAAGSFGVRGIVNAPTTMSFAIPSVGAGPITIAFSSDEPSGSPVLVHGWSVERVQDSETFCRLLVRGSEDLLVDLALDSAPGRAASASIAGPTFAPAELAGRTVIALFDRAAARDFVDVYALS